MKKHRKCVLMISIFLATLASLNRFVKPLYAEISNTQFLEQIYNEKLTKAKSLMDLGEAQLKVLLYRSASQTFGSAISLYLELGNFESALEGTEKLRRIYSYLNDVRRLQLLESQEANIYIAMKQQNGEGFIQHLSDINLRYKLFNPLQIDDSISTLEKKLAQTNQDEEVKTILIDLGLAYSMRGDSYQAITSFQKGLDLVSESDENRYTELFLLYLGETYLQENDYPKAISSLKKSLEVIREERERIAKLTNLESHNNEFLSAYFASTDEEIFLSHNIERLSALAVAYLKSGELTEAMNVARAAISDLERIKQISNDDLLVSTQTEAFITLHLVLGRTLFEADQLEGAEENFKQAFEQAYRLITEPVFYNTSALFSQGEFVQLYYLEMLSRASSHLQNVLILQGKVEEALEVSEQSRALIFKQNFIQDFQNSSLGSSLPSAEEQLVNILAESSRNDQRSYLEAKLSQSDLTSQERDFFEQRLADLGNSSFEDEVREELPSMAAEVGGIENLLSLVEQFAPSMPGISLNIPRNQQVNTPESLSFQDILNLTKEQQTTLVYYSVISDSLDFIPAHMRSPKNSLRFQVPDKKVFIWVVQLNGKVDFRSIPLPEGQSLRQFVTESRSQLGVRGYGDFNQKELDNTNSQKALQDLHKILIEPIQDLLPSDPTQHVTFIPDDSLFFVPFAALLNDSGEALIDRHTILLNPSIKSLEFTQMQRDKIPDSESFFWSGSEVLIVGNPVMPSLPTSPFRLSNLLGAEVEADNIASQFSTKAIKGLDATKPKIFSLMPKSRVIHFATHGILDDVQQFGSPGAIALTPIGVDDGWLTTTEIADFNLQAELVVLSACDTGGGILTGDGIVGLSRAFFEAGVPTVVSSLWKVPDKATALLMENFYQNLRIYPSKAQALRQAMLTTREVYPDPLSWSSFVLLGEAD